MPTAALKFAPILVLLAPTMGAAQQAGASAARATMAVSLTVADGSVAKPFDGERFPLEQVDDAYARLREGSLDGRAVICPNG